jgi:hypothetical protein
MDETIHHAVEDVGRALEWLVSQGYLERNATRAADPIFSLDKRKLSEAEKLIAKPKRAAKHADHAN